MNSASTFAAAWAVVVALGALSVAALARAQAQDGRASRARDLADELQKRFAAADRNGDGRLTRDEAQAGMPMVHQHFDEIDKARAGTITLADIVAFVKERRAAKQCGG
jgi:Ca2+-binding EF-hand superfamily protein